MKLLIVTQVVDKEHPILGFFHRWIEEFASQCEQVHVICLQAGTYDLPSNITVHSLGKEAGAGRLAYLWRFYALIWQLRHEYDNVFVHMNQIYVLLGALFWHIAGKQVGLWYAHGAVSASLRAAVPLTHHVFTSTKEGLRIDTTKKRIVGQGIDTSLFALPAVPRTTTDTLQLVTVGRIAPAKNIDTLLRACAELAQKQIKFHFNIIGVATTESERQYGAAMKALVKELALQEYVTWVGAVTQSELPGYLQQSDVFIHDGATNSLDKTLLEAVLCGCLVVSSNPAYRTIAESHTPDLIFVPKSDVALANILTSITSSTTTCSRMKLIQQHIVANYSINKLCVSLLKCYIN